MSDYWKWFTKAAQEVAITGISGRLPESDNIHEFRDNLFEKRDMVTEEQRRWTIDHSEVPKCTGELKSIDKFDGGYFGVHYRLANFLDPMARILLETVVEAVMDAGINPAELQGTRTGIIVAFSVSETQVTTYYNFTEENLPIFAGTFRSFLASRISYFLKVKGPAVLVDTACSSTLYALDLGIQAITSDQCDNVLVCGTTLNLHPGPNIQFTRYGALCRDGKCKVFDEGANGYVRADTIGCILLQKKKNARRLYCQILHSIGNSDGYKDQGITFPSTEMQSQLMKDVLQHADIHPDQVDYMEAHGTGTKAGDAEEVKSIDNAIGIRRTSPRPLLIGAVKSSAGHAEAASGMTAIFKVILAMETGFIPPNMHLKVIKKDLTAIHEGRLKVVTELTKLEKEDAVVGVNNFGMGGTNAHLLLKRFNKPKNKLENESLSRLVCVSGRTEEAVLGILEDVGRRDLDVEYIALIHQIFKNGVERHMYRGFTIVSKHGAINTSVMKCDHFQAPWHVYFGDFTKNFKIIGRHLLQYDCFKNIVQKMNKLVGAKIDVVDTINNERPTKNDVVVSVMVQIAFLELLEVLGLKPNAVVGKSLGDLGRAYFYKAVTLEELVKNVLRPTSDNLHQIARNGLHCEKAEIVLNLSDEVMNDNSLQIVDENDSTAFLEILGRLYELGYNPQVQKLYPEVQFPVSRGTPMISPLVKWNHSKSWYAYKFSAFSKSEQQTYAYFLQNEDHKFILGHMIDGRNLLPATEYLNIVWKTLASSTGQQQEELAVVFEDCKFIRALSVPESGNVSVSVSLQRSNGQFEVIDQNSSVLVCGRIFAPEDISLYQTDLAPLEADMEDPVQVIEHDDFYGELNLRGYNYKDSFKKLLKCSVDASVGLIEWEDNWTTFLDIMLQTKIFQLDTRLLYIPTGIRRFTVDPKKHLDFVSNQSDSLCPVFAYEAENVIKCGGIEIVGFTTTSINKRGQLARPVLEKNIFVPNTGRFDLETSLRIITQVVLENSLENNVKAVEVLDNSEQSEFLMPLIAKTLDDFPMVTHDLIVSTNKMPKAVEGVKFEEFVLTCSSNLLLIVVSNLLKWATFPTNIFNALKPSGFMLSREDIDFVAQNTTNVEIVQEFVTDKEKLILFRKPNQSKKTQFLEIKSNNFDWIPQLQLALKTDDNIAVVGQNQEPEGVLGFLNCIRREQGGDRVRGFFLMDKVPDFDPSNSFYGDQLKKDLAVNVYRDGSWGSYRHLLLEDIGEVETEHCYVEATKRGDLSSLKWLEGPLHRDTKLPDHEILVFPYYSPVNFKDIMTASGRVGADAVTDDRLMQEHLQGLEFCGRDISGRRVMGMSLNKSFATMIAVDERYIAEVPDDWSMEDAATTFVVYTTVLYALLEVGKLRRGSSILIHSGTGGVGLAAISVCLHYGCDIFTTVGTEEKRDFIKKRFPQIPDSHIGNSRDTTFEGMIKKETAKRGVDYVLNSLADEKLLASVRCLGEGGRFLEIGKFDISNNTQLSLLMFKKNISFHGIMIDKIVDDRNKEKLIKVLRLGLREGYVKPLPKTIFQKHETEKAFRYMGTGKHIGKVLIKIRDEESDKTALPPVISAPAHPRFNCDFNKSYVIVGGLGGFGLELSDWLFLRGAKKLVLVSRYGVQTGLHTLRIRNWSSYGVSVKVSTADVSTKEGCFKLLREANELGPVDGIFNLAAVLRDAAFENQTQDAFLTSLAPKAEATKFLDQVSRKLCPELRHFVVFSSLSCGRGNPGQTNYGMGNSIMERICEKRKVDGLPGLAIQWGPIGDVGMVTKMQKKNKELVISGTLPQRIVSCLEVMDRFLKQDNAVVSSIVVAQKNKIRSDSPVDAVARILGIEDIKSAGFYKTLAELGTDSITTTEICQILEKDFGIFISAKDVRALTFTRLMEIQTEQQNVSTTHSDNTGREQQLFVTKPGAQHLRVEKMPSGDSEENESDDTVLVFPGIEGDYEPFTSIIAKIKAHVFGVHYSYNDLEQTAETIAANLLPSIERIFPDGKSFKIIGYSFGVIVAQEVIGLLERKGYTGLFIAIDGSISYVIAGARAICFMDKTSLIYTLLSNLLEEPQLSEYVEKLHQMTDNFKDQLAYVDQLIPTNNSEATPLETSVVLFKRIKALLDYSYLHDKIKSSVLLLKADIPIVREIEDDYGLFQICTKPVRRIVVNGDHRTILNDLYLVQCINTFLNLVE